LHTLKKMFRELQGKNKSLLSQIFIASDDLNQYRHNDLLFEFSCSNRRAINSLQMSVVLPAGAMQGCEFPVFAEDYVLRMLGGEIQAVSDEYANPEKDAQSRCFVECQRAGSAILRRSGAGSVFESGVLKSICVRLFVRLPLLNGTFIDGRRGARFTADIIKAVERGLGAFDPADFDKKLAVYRSQQSIRRYLDEHGLVAFIADGSVLPRENDTEKPLANALKFISPAELSVEIPLPGGGKIRGMGVKRGVTVVTGGGYSGKSTLLDAVEAGVADRVSGDGREFVITRASAVKVGAEDGRPVQSLDMSAFFGFFPGNVGADVAAFSTHHASGSVSQAANIIEAVAAGASLLLIDEDRSASNFMIRDGVMRKILRRDPIIPYTDRVRELADAGVSTILVMGASSEYLKYADTIILMEDYAAARITAALPPPEPPPPPAVWARPRRLIPRETAAPFLYFRTVTSENAKIIILDDFTANITLLTSVESQEQINALSAAAEALLTDKNAGEHSLSELCAAAAQGIFEQYGGATRERDLFLESVRPIDIFMCVSRMRGAKIVDGAGAQDQKTQK
jgi:hypothetical protein